MEVKLYVGNLAYSTTEKDLRLLFARAGDVSSVDLIKDRDSRQSGGFAFVTMGTLTGAQRAISMFNAFSLADRELKVTAAKPREARSAFQSRFSAFALPSQGSNVTTRKLQKAPGGFQTRFSAFGNDSNPAQPRRRRGRQRQ